MKIGQLTFHASHNYGSVLQAYALSKYLQMLGHETEFINLRPLAQLETYRIVQPNLHGVHKAYRYLIYPALRRRYLEFERFITRVLPLSAEEYHSTRELKERRFDYDAYVCGGDQIWNPACQDFEPAYYLQFLPPEDTSRRIAYSPSLGKTQFDEQTQAQLGRWVRCFDAVSVREQRGAALIERVSGRPVQTVCDPVLLLDRAQWEQLAVKPRYKKPYILVYFLENNHGRRDLIESLRQTLGFDVVVLNEYVRDLFKPYHRAYGASPEEFVGLFLNAAFVYTNSFHGTTFSTLFGKPFLTAVAPDQENAENNNDSRKIDYLTRLGLEARLYTGGTPDMQSLLQVDYQNAGARLREFREESGQFLIRALEERNQR